MFDECPAYPSTYEYMKDSVERTLRWAKRCRIVIQAINLIWYSSRWKYEDLRKHSAISTVEIDFDGYAIGELVLVRKDVMYK